ncbi:enoyl-CoA hydratase/isomerase family protein [Acidimicrobiaceae bacterium AH-315-P05]|nr:enoyl-CoA hydratase/isomerase family protein [Acidimicrobiaceae bacterium AH-315-P05]
MAVDIEESNSVVYLTLNRPEKLNSVDEEMAAELLDAIGRVAASDSRAMVISGAGRGFCAGRDLEGAEPLTEDAEAILIDTFNPLFRAIRAISFPTIAQVHGPALGVGLGLALACDLVYVAESAKVGSPFANIGAVLDSGGHRYLVQRVGSHLALELIYTGRLISGTEAAAIGLVNRAVEDDQLGDTVRALAEKIADGPSAAFALSKTLVQQIEDDHPNFADVLAAEAVAQGAAARTADYAEGIMAFQDKRRASFTGK